MYIYIKLNGYETQNPPQCFIQSYMYLSWNWMPSAQISKDNQLENK